MNKIKFGQGLVAIGIIGSLISVAAIGGEVAITTVATASLLIGVILVNVGRGEKSEV